MLSQEIAWLLKEKYQGEKTKGFFTDCTRLESGEPLAYIIGSIPFLGTTIYLNSKPLIPRVETEFWIEKLILYIKKRVSEGQRNITLLDLCAGSGCIGVAVANAIPEVTVHFVELEEEHLDTIKINCLSNSIDEKRFKLFQGDLFLVENKALKKYDYIVSNPPYIDPKLNRTENSVRKFEPRNALYGGINGMELISKIIRQSASYLLKNGELWLEHEPEQAVLIKTVASNKFSTTTNFDQYNVVRYSQLVLK